MLHTVGAVGAAYGAYVGLLNLLVKIAIVLSVACSLDRVIHVLLYAKFKAKAFLTGRRPEDEFSCRPLPDPAAYALVYPKVAVQLPMFNERAVCQAIIDSACEMAWPRERFCVQVNWGCEVVGERGGVGWCTEEEETLRGGRGRA
jgi:beta-mannan synthase